MSPKHPFIVAIFCFLATTRAQHQGFFLDNDERQVFACHCYGGDKLSIGMTPKNWTGGDPLAITAFAELLPRNDRMVGTFHSIFPYLSGMIELDTTTWTGSLNGEPWTLIQLNDTTPDPMCCGQSSHGGRLEDFGGLVGLWERTYPSSNLFVEICDDGTGFMDMPGVFSTHLYGNWLNPWKSRWWAIQTDFNEFQFGFLLSDGTMFGNAAVEKPSIYIHNGEIYVRAQNQTHSYCLEPANDDNCELSPDLWYPSDIDSDTAHLQEWFNFWDTDSDACLINTEIEHLYHDYSSLPEADIEMIVMVLMFDFDENFDGCVDLDESQIRHGLVETIQANFGEHLCTVSLDGVPDSFMRGYACDDMTPYAELSDAEYECCNNCDECRGVTESADGKFTIRKGPNLSKSVSGEVSYPTSDIRTECTFASVPNSFLLGYACDNNYRYSTLADAEVACCSCDTCGGVVKAPNTEEYTIRASSTPISFGQETSFVKER